jgi:hypothetical protein
MNNIEMLVIDNYPKINGSIISTEFDIDADEEISISINDSNIFCKEDVISIAKNHIELPKDIKMSKNDTIVVIYNKI